MCACRSACRAWRATAPDRGGAPVTALHEGPVFEPAYYIRRALKLFEECRKQLGEEVELLHDVHERVSPNQAVQFAKDVEKFQLFFLEDPLSPEDIAYFRQIRQQCATPIAMGELFNSPHEWTPLITERLIDYIRIHVSQVGGLTPCPQDRGAWPRSTACAPPGTARATCRRSATAANVTLDLVCYNFGIQEYSAVQRPPAGSLPGLPGDEERLPLRERSAGLGHRSRRKAGGEVSVRQPRERGEHQRLNGGWGEVRRRDGTIIKQ